MEKERQRRLSEARDQMQLQVRTYVVRGHRWLALEHDTLCQASHALHAAPGGVLHQQRFGVLGAMGAMTVCVLAFKLL